MLINEPANFKNMSYGRRASRLSYRDAEKFNAGSRYLLTELTYNYT